MQVRLGTRCLAQSECDADAQCCVVSSYVIKRGKCAARLTYVLNFLDFLSILDFGAPVWADILWYGFCQHYNVVCITVI